MIIKWKKGERRPLSLNFFTDEFDCSCDNPDCAPFVNENLIIKLQALRTEVGRPLIITSGFRCSDYQNKLRSKGAKTSVGPSSHERGWAADIALPPGTSPVIWDDLRYTAVLHFKAIGDNSRGARPFIHVDLRDDKERRWTY